MPTQKCAHPACRCQAREHSNYCSDFCEKAATAGTMGSEPKSGCQCGHPDCK